MSALAVPDKSQLLLVDPVPEYLQQLGCDVAGQVLEQFKLLSAAADGALVPRNFAVSQDTGERDTWLSTPCEKQKPRVFRFERDRSVWSNSQLLEAVNHESRDQLFICGFWLDDVVAAAAIEAQTFGFDTHVILDLSLAYNREKRQPVFDRFHQYGIIPMFLQNLLYEWMAKTDDDARRRALEALWQQQRLFDRQNNTGVQSGSPESDI